MTIIIGLSLSLDYHYHWIIIIIGLSLSLSLDHDALDVTVRDLTVQGHTPLALCPLTDMAPHCTGTPTTGTDI